MPLRRQGEALGSALLLLVGDDAPRGLVDAAWAAIMAEFARADDAMSRFREDSELTRLNRAGHAQAGSRALMTALALADRAGRATDGRFDARILRDLERLGAPGVPQGVRDEPRHVGPSRLVELDRRTGALALPSPVDLGGLGKGLALRWAARAAGRLLRDVGFLIDAGGDIVCRGAIDGGPWSIGIEDPAGEPEPIATCALVGGEAIATSSVRIGRWRDAGGREVHHLIDPATGEPGGRGLAAVTVAWSDPAWAEVWSKALFLAGIAGVAATARRRGLAAWWVTTDGALSMTPAARQRTTWVRAEARRDATRAAEAQRARSARAAAS